MSKGENWNLEGDYFEHCSCEALCPCLLSVYQAEPTYGDCQTLVAYHISEGNFKGIQLNDLNVAMLIWVPGKMADGSYSLGLYVDERASEEQFDSLHLIFSGEMGGPPANIRSLTTEFLGTKRVPIRYESKGDKSRSLEIPDLASVRLEAFRGHRGRTVWIDNVAHLSQRIAPGKTVHAEVKDYRFQWSNPGKNGFLGPFHWKG
ncbi:DUF1326 domain-containing protein [Leptospira langatensis]|uniref:DUF1326 domain-containing protein n=1 Tax=Leptospira langatensis TaxID=2484983 RepID=A0A5F1ZUX7_9LEPT|nr:DUF1326 domain-containing protein [Leptospira langatensis]TGK00311.1 DUF1326 domain-containing protein [Leptospira langatensis]TGL41052.1 DUF1326 domain-containing protein [Leptospira langatensis]